MCLSQVCLITSTEWPYKLRGPPPSTALPISQSQLHWSQYSHDYAKLFQNCGVKRIFFSGVLYNILQDCKRLPRVHLTGYWGLKFSIVRTWVLIFVRIWFLSHFSFKVLLQLDFFRVFFSRWVFEFSCYLSF